MQNVFISAHFKRQLKPYVKKYRSITDDVADLLDGFDKRQHIDLGHGLYKARLKSRDIPRGKSKSFRTIIFFIESEEIFAPIAIYFKGVQEELSQKELNDHLQEVLTELRRIGIFSV
ncbi:MAG: type II toxin-antitoxin system RelE/ParE family toxin [Candidatus Uhrbacteria bacterium]|nr:type II toxin-antitoxin system RelE/ParE family toxin [Candidatus Uhrbacteria bacterium]